jgi:hypothetical protein
MEERMSPKPTKTIQTIDANTTTPEAALDRLVKELQTGGIDALLGKGQRFNSMRIAAGRLHTALEQVRALEEEAAKLRANMGALVTEALDAIAGKAPLAKPKATPAVNGGDPASATVAPTV